MGRHWRFLAAAAAGLGAGLATPLPTATPRLLIGADVLFVVYLAATGIFARNADADDLRRHAQEEDEGVLLILLIAVAAVAVSLAAVFSALAAPGAAGWQRAAALLSVPLGWVTLHTLFAFRYAHLWYAPGEAGGTRGGLEFGGGDPGLVEFLYYSFTIGMTAQTSDVQVTTAAMRRVTLWQAVVSFFYNAVLIALAVNAGAAMLGIPRA